MHIYCFLVKEITKCAEIFTRVGFITYLLILVKYGSVYIHFTNVVHGL